MIVLLNLLVVIVTVGAVALAFHIRKFWPVIVALVFSLLYNAIQPSYMPKGVVHKPEIPAFEQSAAKIQDRLLKPQSGEVYDAARNEQIKNGLPFIKEGEK